MVTYASLRREMIQAIEVRRSDPVKKVLNTHANSKDFCKAFESEMNSMYLLAFLITGKHQLAERAFIRILQEVQSDNGVVKSHVSDWIRHRLIEDAISAISPRKEQQPDLWFGETEAAFYINSVTQLVLVERFVFVLTVLEGYSTRECCLVLGINPHAVAEAKSSALDKLGRFVTRTNTSPGFLQATA